MPVRHHGFTLIELMLALAISAILIAVTYPSYVSYQAHAERNRAEVALLQLSADMETYFSDNDSYEDASLKNLHATHLVDDLDYQLRIVKATDAHYEIQAVPMGVQAAHDSACGTLALTDENKRTISGDGDADACWR
jgi:type IV pilus assembly protein PilE